MFVLGLGSNLGDSVNNLRLAVQHLSEYGIYSLKTSSIYYSTALLPPYAPATWNKPYLNIAILCTAKLSPSEVLKRAKQVEQQMGREITQRWAPRCIDIDLLTWGNQVITQADLCVPHIELIKRPFALWPLLEVLPSWQHPQHAQKISKILQDWGSPLQGKAPFNTQRLPQTFLGTQLLGILNITPDSFSDGGRFLNHPKALAQAEKLVQEGAEILDVGAESTRPGANPLSAKEEWERLFPFLTQLITSSKTWRFQPKISLDTRHAAVAEKAIDLGIDWINDVSGFSSSAMRYLAKQHAVRCVVMHNLGVPADKNKILPLNSNVCQTVLHWAEKRFEKLYSEGIKPEQLIFDVGIGFGKTAQQSAELLKNIEQFRTLNCPLLVGHSRKSFLNLVTDKPFCQRDMETAFLSYQLACQQVDYLRVHDVALNIQAVQMAQQWQALNTYTNCDKKVFAGTITGVS